MPVEVPIELERGRPFVEVSIDGEGPFRFLVDTGASGHGRIDRAVVQRLGLPVVATTEHEDGVATASIDVVTPASVSVGGLVVERPTMLTRDYNPPGRAADLARIDGILGLAFFDGVVATIDSPGRRLILEAGRLDEAARHVVRFAPPIEIPVRVGARTFGCSVDTGSTLTMHLPLSVAGELVAGELSGGEAGRRANTRFSLRRGRLADEVRFADNQVPDVVARFSDRARGVNLGAGVLSRFAVSVDPRSRLLRIAPTPPRRSGPEAALLPR